MPRYLQQLDRVCRYLGRLEHLYDHPVTNRPTDELLDDVYGFFLHCHNLKDWLKNDPAFARAPQVEAYVSSTPSLSLCADICNKAKHLMLNRLLRTGVEPSLPVGELIVELTDSFSESDVAREEPVTVSIRVFIEHNGATLDARDIARDAVAAWESFVQ